MSNNLQQKFKEFMSEYKNCIETSRFNHDNSLAKLFKQDIVDQIIYYIDRNKYIVHGSLGQGNWASTPWIAIFDKRITTSAQEGVYVVYLLNKDTKTLYLTLNQGVSKEGNGNSAKGREKLKKYAEYIKSNINTSIFVTDDDIQTGKKAYDAGCICYKKYDLSTIPGDPELIADLKDILSVYERYYKWSNNIDFTEIDAAANISNGALLEESDEEMTKNTKKILSAIKSYIAAAGFSYSGNLIENFYLSLKSKPFVILAGTSGTGKTRLAKLFAEAISAKYRLVPVRPDWSDSSDLFGHVDLNGNFVAGAIIDFVKEAKENPERPYILCLDEMNLARVEYYLSDFLSVIETREMKSGRIVSDPLIDVNKYGNDTDAMKKYGRIEYPENLYVVGTVNMDETTFPFSKKVLDRANTIEFNYVDLIPNFTEFEEKREALPLENSFLKTEYLILNDCVEAAEYISDLCAELQDINKILQTANAHVGYRVRDEIVFYMLNNRLENGAILEDNEAFDNCLIQKILPRVQGSNASVRDMLCELFKICAVDHNQKTGDRDSDKMKKILDDESIKCRYRKSAEKILLMVRRFEEDGFTSYWL